MSKSKKRVFLLEKANYVPMKDGQGEYDKRKSLNVVKNDKNNYVPVLSLNDAPPTQSKTEVRPGDDDPDPEVNRCY